MKFTKETVKDFVSLANKVLNNQWEHSELDSYVNVGGFNCSIIVDGCIYYDITYTDGEDVVYLFSEIPASNEEKMVREKMMEFLRTKLALIKLQSELNCW